jgi:hypothetical protein
LNQKSLTIAVALAAAALVATIATAPMAYAEEDDDHGKDGQKSETNTELKGKCKDNQSGQGNIQLCIPINAFVPVDVIG